MATEEKEEESVHTHEEFTAKKVKPELPTNLSKAGVNLEVDLALEPVQDHGRLG